MTKLSVTLNDLKVTSAVCNLSYFGIIAYITCNMFLHVNLKAYWAYNF